MSLDGRDLLEYVERKKKEDKEKRQDYKGLILAHKDKIWTPIEGNIPTPLVFNDFEVIPVPDNAKVKAMKCCLKPTKKQKHILLSWLKDCTKMFNHTISHIQPHAKLFCDGYFGSLDKVKENEVIVANTKKEKAKLVRRKNQTASILQQTADIEKILVSQQEKLKEAKDVLDKICNDFKSNLNYKDLRTYVLRDFRDSIIKTSKDKFGEKAYIKTHILDCSIKQACANYKTLLDNYTHRRIKSIEVFEQAYSRDNRVMEVEKDYWSSKGFLFSSLGKLDLYYNDKPVSNDLLNHTCFIRYSRKTNSFAFNFAVPWSEAEIKPSLKRVVSIDPGVRVPLTCMSEDDFADLGVVTKEKVEKLITKRDEAIFSDKISPSQRRTVMKKINKKIKNVVNDFHWKTCKTLTQTYQNIIIGNMSVKGIVKKGGVLKGFDRKVTLSMSLGKFRNRLKFKCQEQNKSLKIIDEFCTSQMCSHCGWENFGLGGNKVFTCKNRNCNLVIDRDLNSCRGMFIKTFNIKNIVGSS